MCLCFFVCPRSSHRDQRCAAAGHKLAAWLLMRQATLPFVGSCMLKSPTSVRALFMSVLHAGIGAALQLGINWLPGCFMRQAGLPLMLSCKLNTPDCICVCASCLLVCSRRDWRRAAAGHKLAAWLLHAPSRPAAALGAVDGAVVHCTVRCCCDGGWCSE
jgi:hypothetical protein